MALRVLVREVGDIGSAVAHRLFLAGRVVAVRDGEQPTTRRGMAFADAIFDSQTTLDGVEAIRVDELEAVSAILVRHAVVPVGGSRRSGGALGATSAEAEGARLAAGQQQLLALARALAHRPTASCSSTKGAS